MAPTTSSTDTPTLDPGDGKQVRLIRRHDLQGEKRRIHDDMNDTRRKIGRLECLPAIVSELLQKSLRDDAAMQRLQEQADTERVSSSGEGLAARGADYFEHTAQLHQDLLLRQLDENQALRVEVKGRVTTPSSTERDRTAAAVLQQCQNILHTLLYNHHHHHLSTKAIPHPVSSY